MERFTRSIFVLVVLISAMPIAAQQLVRGYDRYVTPSPIPTHTAYRVSRESSSQALVLTVFFFVVVLCLLIRKKKNLTMLVLCSFLALGCQRRVAPPTLQAQMQILEERGENTEERMDALSQQFDALATKYFRDLDEDLSAVESGRKKKASDNFFYQKRLMALNDCRFDSRAINQIIDRMIALSEQGKVEHFEDGHKAFCEVMARYRPQNWKKQKRQ